jgi:hypothetical protein
MFGRRRRQTRRVARRSLRQVSTRGRVGLGTAAAGVAGAAVLRRHRI